MGGTGWSGDLKWVEQAGQVTLEWVEQDGQVTLDWVG